MEGDIKLLRQIASYAELYINAELAIQRSTLRKVLVGLLAEAKTRRLLCVTSHTK